MQSLQGKRNPTVDPCVNLDSYTHLVLTRTAAALAFTRGDDALAPHIASEVHPQAGMRSTHRSNAMLATRSRS